MTRRRIAVVTGTRADYGHMKWMLSDLAANPAVNLMVVAAAAHLSPHHGDTLREIEADGLLVAARVDMLLAGDSPIAVAKSMGLGVIGFAEAFATLKPDLVVLLGDRYEALAAAETAMIMRIPVAHLHGGEATEGLIDEAIRHSITKMAQLHFVAAEPYRRRVIQLGEQPDRVFAFGAPGLDHLTRTKFLDRAQLEQSLGLPLNSPLLLVTYHPVTLSDEDQAAAAHELVSALQTFSDATAIITGVNADPSASAISRVLHDFAAGHPHRIRVFDSLGYLRYLSLVRIADAVIGNSSSGIIEVPALGVSTINIGERQQGRLRSPSVIDCGPQRDEIAAAIAHALSPEGRAVAAAAISAYGQGDASRRIATVLASQPLNGLLMKQFHDLPCA